MSLSSTGRSARSTRATLFAPRLGELLHRHRGADLFRLEPDTVGVAGVELMDTLLSARPANAEERPTFKPVQGRLVTRTDAAGLMQAVSADVRAALKKPLGSAVDLSGRWPHVPHVYLRDLVFGEESLRFRILVDRRLELTPKLTWAAVAAGTAMLGKPGTEVPLSNLAARVLDAKTYDDRRYAMYLYRRVAAPVCFTVAALVTNALWLGAPFDDGESNRDILLEALRLLPPSWNILRQASPEFTAVDSRIGPQDDILILPLLSHRDPRLWEDPNTFRPERWVGLDPDTQPGYLPFGHADERCWGRHMVMPLAERLLDLVRRDGLVVSPGQAAGRVELDGLLEVSGVRVVRS
ncbi:cytochrome P450 [Kitasatospora sp. MMS16-BH015]|uniref:cytochrome P450 n=1 Tax=Kitasatospora sp. MMS16-BH015 TaxID=2018025 RepID=UPI000CA32BC7|nr:cytochrome P450 [Kitasatospora sp. MMS16-BH015]AUG80553.1 cytochrome P450 [Kitasatospora sp. MMS16-BH015]